MNMATSRDFKPTIRIGKSGITPQVEQELSDQLKTKNLVKVKVNKGLFERKQLSDVWEHLKKTSSSNLILQRGNVAVFYKS